LLLLRYLLLFCGLSLLVMSILLMLKLALRIALHARWSSVCLTPSMMCLESFPFLRSRVRFSALCDKIDDAEGAVSPRGMPLAKPDYGFRELQYGWSAG
jgi:hypothetical protein